MKEGWVSLGDINLKSEILVIWLSKIWGILKNFVERNPNNLLKEDIFQSEEIFKWFVLFSFVFLNPMKEFSNSSKEYEVFGIWVSDLLVVVKC